MQGLYQRMVSRWCFQVPGEEGRVLLTNRCQCHRGISPAGVSIRHFAYGYLDQGVRFFLNCRLEVLSKFVG